MAYIDADKLITFANNHKNKIIDANDIARFPTADVVPKSEVDKLKTEIKILTENSITSKYPCRVSCSKGLILTKSLEDYDKLLADIASEVAREIFEEIEKILIDSTHIPDCARFVDIDKLAELENKYTEGEHNE